MKQRTLLTWLAAALYFVAMIGIPTAAFSVATFGDAQVVMAADDDAAADDGAKKESLLMWTYRSLGPLYSFVFLGISFALVAMGFKYYMQMRPAVNIPADLQAQFEELVTNRQFSEAYELVKEDDTYLGRVLAAGMAKVASGYDKSVAAMEETSDDISMGYAQGLSYIGLIAAISTSVGLLGTVHGMIMSFQVIATATAAPKPNELAGGISTAMFTTMVGLVVSIPASCLFLFLKNRMDRIVFEAGTISEDLIGKLLAAASKK
ncbi:MAG: MotA/TolQ/ExbB proton channel family protein [Planctomycetaceae bacterium]|nr:MotA/TolQ/ExbB proton channel family protein [Planctomycetaceae bacterium]MBQ2821508.1 MotA/TolQ/ExbB proton channel family protein [Thermoguttaceae bacterium]